mmetsp:Transcript_56071/g.119373  ORF Transcript_56071/g.119373 Transcript_56071/m.119373 type:complete len:379 (-) Transcript_56071:706-1842(-)|eukprot:CAMPEP_0206448166 /NCGR_PEP_ID=MMETSP0324_2-20121206/17279_1 /ASSEMBLY_ACC=CAM_ASM_000836 /TAXON_ID=2866 /ORGANISM="Crypthecodinium cohnii, Strain Seligo" /LENGTH=378 /DNA_ID=CAMNT_0053917195 /DNA_START=217 /DNA_END=1353 /DNA_ORIENTATION=-
MSIITFFEYPDPMVWWQVTLYLMAAAWGGFIVGCFGVGGGAIYAPLMLMLPGMEAQVAVGTVMVGVLPSSCFRSIQLFCYGGLDVPAALPLMSGAALGALAGQAALKVVPAVAVAIVVAVVAIGAGVQIQAKMCKERRLQLANEEQAKQEAAVATPAATTGADSATATSPPNSNDESTDDVPIPGGIAAEAAGNSGDAYESDTTSSSLEDASTARRCCCFKKGGDEDTTPRTMEAGGAGRGPTTGKGSCKLTHSEIIAKIVIGFVAALMSSVSGTGGPLILFPILLFWKPHIEMKTLVSFSVPFALTTTLFSAVGALTMGRVDIGFALILAATTICSTLAGGCLMQRLGDSSLKLGIGLVLILVGVAVGTRTVISIVS